MTAENPSRSWEETIGPFYGHSFVAKKLLIDEDTLDELAADKHLLQLHDGQRRLYPAFTFGHTEVFGLGFGFGLTTVPGLHETLVALKRGSDDRWLWALWLSGQIEKHGGWCAIDELLTGERERVLERARNEDWAWTIS